MCEIIDFEEFRRSKAVKQIQHQMGFPKHETVIRVELIKTVNGDPAVYILSTDGVFLHTITNGFAIYHCNEFFKGFGFDINVKFETYGQYGMLIWKINELIKKKNK
ncbi:MAG: hypothetical protein LIO60_04515 [Oscillospiraceae bacterium]|nr:hypothetical protein [Oscillospiraceae bacterium]